MVEIKNIEVFNLERAIRAIENSFNVGEINTTEGLIKEKLGKSLFGNKDYMQSHNAASAGVIVQFILKCSKKLKSKLDGFHFLEISKLKNGGYFVTTNFRQLAHIVASKNYFTSKDEKEFISKILEIEKFKYFCNLEG